MVTNPLHRTGTQQIFDSAMRTQGDNQEMISLHAERARIVTLLLYLWLFQTNFSSFSSSTINVYINTQAVLERIDQKPTLAMKV